MCVLQKHGNKRTAMKIEQNFLQAIKSNSPCVPYSTVIQRTTIWEKN